MRKIRKYYAEEYTKIFHGTMIARDLVKTSTQRADTCLSSVASRS
jgi:hypothetical protein